MSNFFASYHLKNYIFHIVIIKLFCLHNLSACLNPCVCKHNTYTYPPFSPEGITMNKSILIKTLAVVGLSASIGWAQAGAIDALKQFNNDADGISGTFSQTVTSKKKKQTSSGSFQILRPGLFKWEYNKPYQQTIVGDGKTIWLYDVDLKQVTKSNQNQAIGDSPAAILSNKTALDSSYTLKEDGSKNGIDYVLATPKKNNAGYQFIRIGFKGNQLAAMELKDSFGNQTHISFNHLNTKPNLSRNAFTFTPPTGVDVLSH